MTSDKKSAPREARHDLPAELAEAAARIVCEAWLDGAGAADAKALGAMLAHVRQWPNSKPESPWIMARAQAPGLPGWGELGWARRHAVMAWLGVLSTMDMALMPEPPAPVAPEAPKRRMKSALRRSTRGRSIFARG